jgi:hypothetical protein
MRDCQQQQNGTGPAVSWRGRRCGIQQQLCHRKRLETTTALLEWKSLFAKHLRRYTTKVSSTTTTTTTATTTIRLHPRFYGTTLLHDGCHRSLCCQCCCSLVNGKTFYQVGTERTNTTTNSSSRCNNSSSSCPYNPCSTMKRVSFPIIIILVLVPLLLHVWLMGDWKSMNRVILIPIPAVAAASANNYYYRDYDYLSHPSTGYNNNQRSIRTFLIIQGGQQIPLSGGSSSNSNNNNNNNNSTSSSTNINDIDSIVPTRRGTMTSSSSRNNRQSKTSTTTTTTTNLLFGTGAGYPVPSSAIPRRYNFPVNYQYFARKHGHYRHSTLHQQQQQQQQQSLDSIHFIILGPNLDHWKDVGPILASRGFNIMVCEHVDDDDEEEGDEENGHDQPSGDDHHQHHRRHHLQHDATELILQIMGTSSQ